MQFDFQNIQHCEFGIGRDLAGGAQEFVLVPADANVQTALREMAERTRAEMFGADANPPRYEPGEKHGSTEHLTLPIADPLAAAMHGLHVAVNLPIDAQALGDLGPMFCYFARFRDNQGRRLTAVRRASQFKGVVSARSLLVRLFQDELVLEEDRIFKLDADFDLLVDNLQVHIWRPSGFEFTGRLQQAILAAVPQNVAVLRQQLAIVHWNNLESYAQAHPRAARYLASIREFGNLGQITEQALSDACSSTNVAVTVQAGVVHVPAGHEMGFLEVLDRRRYEVELVPGQPEKFRAPSRRRL